MHTRGGQLSFVQAEEIRRRYAAGGCSQTVLADEFGVTQVMVSLVVRRKVWAVPQDERTCSECGTAFDPIVGNQRCCSKPCNTKRELRLDRKRYAERRTVPDRVCPHCGEDVDHGLTLRATFCSPKCRDAAHNATRKAKWKTGQPAEYVSRAYIIERDGGRCHLCGKTCEPGEIHLDHVLPLALGGDHSAANLRVACAACNLSKGARAVGEQLLLVG